MLPSPKNFMTQMERVGGVGIRGLTSSRSILQSATPRQSGTPMNRSILRCVSTVMIAPVLRLCSLHDNHQVIAECRHERETPDSAVQPIEQRCDAGKVP